ASVWDRRKGLSEFIKLSEFLKADEIIFLVGLSKEQQKNLPNNVLAIERTENISELKDIYSCSDVFLNLTLEDTYPTTNLESIACGTPVITYDTGGSVESIDADSGFIVKKGDFNDLRAKIDLIKKADKEYYK